MFNQAGEGWEDDTLFSGAFQGCNGTGTTVEIHVEDCRPFGSGKLEQLKVPPGYGKHKEKGSVIHRLVPILNCLCYSK